MKRLSRLVLLMALLVSARATGRAVPACPEGPTLPHPRLSCTSFMAATDDGVFLGDSEDAGLGHPLWKDPSAAYAFFREGSENEYGRVHLGWLWQGEYVSFQAGMNDQGLAYALTAVPTTDMVAHPERNYVHGRDSLFDTVLRSAATVEEAIAAIRLFSFTSCSFQIQFADASGRSAVLSPTSDGLFAETHREAGVPALVASTFNLADPAFFLGGDSFRRYEQASDLLLDPDASHPTRDRVAEALQAVARRGPYALNRSHTVYSAIYDLTRLRVKVFQLSLYDTPIEIDLESELLKRDHRIALRSLLPDGRLRSAICSYWAIQAGGAAAVGLCMAGILVISILAIRWVHKRQRRDRHA